MLCQLGGHNSIVHSPLSYTVNPKFWGYIKWNLHIKNNSCVVIRSSNPMKQSARELIECGIQSIDTQDQKTPTEGVQEQEIQEVEAGATQLHIVPHPPTYTHLYIICKKCILLFLLFCFFLCLVNDNTHKYFINIIFFYFYFFLYFL